jgi:hypothetical protein
MLLSHPGTCALVLFIFLGPSISTPTLSFASTTIPTITTATILARIPAVPTDYGPHFTPGQFEPTLHLPPQCTQTIKPDKNGYVPPDTCGSQYKFYPSFGAAVAFSVLFGIIMILHIGQAITYKNGYCWVIIVAAVWETGAFVTRSISTLHQQSSGLALVSQLLVLLAPLCKNPLFRSALWFCTVNLTNEIPGVNAFAYTILGRMIHFYLPSRSILGIRASTLATYFVLLDIVSFIIQLVGGSMGGSGAPVDQIMKGVHIYMGGIGLQEFFIVVFLGVAIKFQLELLQIERSGVLVDKSKTNWRRLLYTVYAVLGLITVGIPISLTTSFSQLTKHF